MKKVVILVLVLVLTFTMTGAASATSAASFSSRNFVAGLTGADEVPPRETRARGIAFIHLNRGESQLGYIIVVARIKNVVAAHIHCGAEGVNGPVGVTLFGGVPAGGGRVNGILAKGTVMAPDAGNACGWITVADVAAAMRSGNTYVNVHTNDGVAPTNTGPGDFPGGEIRGQVKEVGHSH
jgi:hypothetical protein